MRGLILFFLAMSCFSAEVKLKFPLTLGGDFTGKATIKNGKVLKKGSKYFAKNLVVKVKDISTGVGLRDNHVHKKMKFRKYPEVKITKAIGKGGRGVASVEIRGVQKKVPFKFKDEGKKVKFNFDIKLSDFKINRKKEGFTYLGVGVKENVEISGYLDK